MVKIGLRSRRKLSKLRGRGNRFIRPKTFTNKESADTWAKKHGIDKYSLENLKSEENSKQKLRIIVEE